MSYLTDRERLQQLLAELPAVMRESALWQAELPAEESFTSTQSFCLDMMEPHQWLQWVFLPRMLALLTEERPLPDRLALTPYFEEALRGHSQPIEPLLLILRQIDALFYQALN